MVRSELVAGSVRTVTDLWMLSRTSRAEAAESVKRAGLPRPVCTLRKVRMWGSSCMGLLPFLLATQFQTLFFNFLAQFEDAFNHRLGTGRAAIYKGRFFWYAPFGGGWREEIRGHP